MLNQKGAANNEVKQLQEELDEKDAQIKGEFEKTEAVAKVKRDMQQIGNSYNKSMCEAEKELSEVKAQLLRAQETEWSLTKEEADAMQLPRESTENPQRSRRHLASLELQAWGNEAIPENQKGTLTDT